MQLSILMMMTTLMAIMAPFANSLISLGSILLTTALMMTMLVSAVVNSWFAFILFLIYITGLLVLFSYMMAMSPNSYYSPKTKPKLALIIAAMTSITMTPILTLSSMKGKKMFEEEVTAIFEPSSTIMYWTIAVILMFTLLMAVTICFKAAKPLRPFNP